MECQHNICKELRGLKKYRGAGVIIGTIKEGKVNVLLGFEKNQYNKEKYDLWKSNNKGNQKYDGDKDGAFTFFSGSYDSVSKYKPECYIETARRELEEEAKLNFNLDAFTQIINNGTPQLNDNSGGAVFLAPIEYDKTENLDNLVKNAFEDSNQPSHLKEMEYLQYFCIEDTDEIEKNKNTMYPWAYNIISNNKQKIIDNVKNKLKPSDTNPIANNVKQAATDQKQSLDNAVEEGKILYLNTSADDNHMVSTIKLNANFEEYTKKDGKWTRSDPKGGKRKSKPTKKVRRSK
jgi:hypothetical protein